MHLTKGISGFRVTDIMGQMNVGGCGSAFILSGDCSIVHAYSNNTYCQSCQEQLFDSHAYDFFSFPETPTTKINRLHQPKGKNMTATAERRGKGIQWRMG